MNATESDAEKFIKFSCRAEEKSRLITLEIQKLEVRHKCSVLCMYIEYNVVTLTLNWKSSN